ncbi:MAG: hypothetical protein AAFV19_07770 [Pseudomonadota bacterium]
MTVPKCGLCQAAQIPTLEELSFKQESAVRQVGNREMQITDGAVAVHETHIAIDAGGIANPKRIEGRLQGAAVMG